MADFDTLMVELPVKIVSAPSQGVHGADFYINSVIVKNEEGEEIGRINQGLHGGLWLQKGKRTWLLSAQDFWHAMMDKVEQ